MVMACSTKTNGSEKGQTLPITALGLAVLVIFFMGLVRTMQMIALAQFTQETAKFAAEVGARPSGSLLTTRQLAIDEAEAHAVIRAELERALAQVNGLGANKEDVARSATIEILQPADGLCEQFPGDDRCFAVPAIRVTLAVPFNFLGFGLTLTRSGIATTAHLPGSGRELIEPPPPTPISIPTQVATILPTPTATATPPIVRPTDTPAPPTATATPALEQPTSTPIPIPPPTDPRD
jgi:hypothetical protein